MMMMVVKVGLLLMFIGTVSAIKSYERYSVIQVKPKNEDHVVFLRQMMLNNHETDFWAPPRRVGRDVSIMIPPSHVDDVTSQLRNAGIKVRFKTRNVQKRLSRSWPVHESIDLRSISHGYGWMDLNEFNTVHKIYKWMNRTATECRPGIQCEVYTAGQSYEGRPIRVFKISKPGAGRKAYWIDATIHAREWISTATAVNIINHLSQGGDDDAVRLVDQYNWYIMPVVNPDGYSFSFTDERYWRKNRRPNPDYNCVGVDLNRNFDVKWGTEGVSHYPCSDVYCGPNPASEPETVVLQNEASRLANELQGLVTMHSYGYMWMFPYATTLTHSPYSPCERVPDHDDLMEVADAAANAVENTHGTHWERGNSCEVIYAAAGGSDDYAKAHTGIKYVYVVELRGNDFVIDKRQIQPAFEEMWNGIVAMCDAIAAKEG